MCFFEDASTRIITIPARPDNPLFRRSPVRPELQRTTSRDFIATIVSSTERRTLSSNCRSGIDRSVSERPPKSLRRGREMARRRHAGGRISYADLRSQPRQEKRNRRYESHWRDGRSEPETLRAFVTHTRRAEPIDLATFPSGGELTSPPSASASVYPHHLTHLVEPPPD